MSNKVIHIKTITEAHRLLGLQKPKHPLVSAFRHADMKVDPVHVGQKINTDLYMVALKENQEVKLYYGREQYDFQEGTIAFLSPNQVFGFNSVDFSNCEEEWTIAFHPDFIQGTNLGKTIEEYHFFSYEINEALHLSDHEKKLLNELVAKIESEYQNNIDAHTQEIICVNIETLLKYCQRFYSRQFITRQHTHKDKLVQFEKWLKDYFADDLSDKGLPTVKQCGIALNMSDHYLSDLLKAETGKSAKEHIDLYVINKAKSLLLNSDNTISEIAYQLGFNYPNHFSKLFKSKTGLSPSLYRSSN